MSLAEAAKSVVLVFVCEFLYFGYGEVTQDSQMQCIARGAQATTFILAFALGLAAKLEAATAPSAAETLDGASASELPGHIITDPRIAPVQSTSRSA
jgi:hypothetical protein